MIRPTPLALVLCAVALPMIASSVSAQKAGAARQEKEKDDDDDDDGDRRPSAASADIVVTAHRLDNARAAVEPSLGASIYSLSNDIVEDRPGGETGSIAQILSQAPGVAIAGSNQISVRGVAGVQYRINNVILPDGVTDLGERLSPRLAERVDLLAGALPAQYGLQAGGVVNIQTKNGTYFTGGQLELYGGSQGQFQPAFEYAGASGATNYFASGSYTRDGLGLASPEGTREPKHDFGTQVEGLGFVEHVLDARSRVSMLFGTSDEHFQIPERLSINPAFGSDFSANPVDTGRSSSSSQYGALSYLRSDGPATLQVSLSGRHSALTLRPGASAGLPVTGLGGERRARSWAANLQIEGSYKLDVRHTLRAGLIASYDRLANDLNASVRLLGSSTSSAVTAATVSRQRAGTLFIQDEWHLDDRLTLNVGGRLDHVASLASGTRAEPRVSAIWSGPDGLTVHAGYSRYLVAPTLFPSNQLVGLAGTSAAPNGIGTSRPPIETDDYFDVGADKKIEDASFGIDVFQRRADNLLDFVNSGSPLIVRTFSYSHAKLRGIEAHALYGEGPLSGWANFSYVDARAHGLSSGSQYLSAAMIDALAHRDVLPEGVQPYTASAGLSYKLGSVRLTGDMTYGAGARDDWGRQTTPARVPSHVQADVAVVYHLTGLGRRPLDARIDVTNIFDSNYRLSENGNEGIPQWAARRRVFIGLEQSF